MIASALRADIERYASGLRAGDASLATPFEGGSGAGLTPPPASLHPLLAMLEGAALEGGATRLVHQAFFQHMAAASGLPWMTMMRVRCAIPRDALAFLGTTVDECRNRQEEALDALDALVEDPACLPGLRRQLRDLAERFEQLCNEVIRGRRRDDHHISAA